MCLLSVATVAAAGAAVAAAVALVVSSVEKVVQIALKSQLQLRFQPHSIIIIIAVVIIC